MTNLPVNFRYKCANNIKKQIKIACIFFIFWFLFLFFIVYSKTSLLILFISALLLFVYLFLIYNLRFTNIRNGIVVTCNNENYKCLIDTEEGTKNIFISDNTNLKEDDSFFMYDRVISQLSLDGLERIIPFLTKKNVIYIEDKNKTKRNVSICQNLKIDEALDKIAKQSTSLLVNKNNIESIQIVQLYKASSSRVAIGTTDTNSKQYFFVFKTQNKPILVNCGRVDYNFYKPGDMFYLIKMKNKDKYIPIPILY